MRKTIPDTPNKSLIILLGRIKNRFLLSGSSSCLSNVEWRLEVVDIALDLWDVLDPTLTLPPRCDSKKIKNAADNFSLLLKVKLR